MVPQWQVITSLMDTHLGQTQKGRRLDIVRAIECDEVTEDQGKEEAAAEAEDGEDEDDGDVVSSSSTKRRSNGKGKQNARRKQAKKKSGSSASSGSGSSGLSAEGPREPRRCIGIKIQDSANYSPPGLAEAVVRGLRDGMES